jgi:hypothetical protein
LSLGAGCRLARRARPSELARRALNILFFDSD